MTPEAIMITLRHAGWSLGHVAQAARDGHRVSVAVRTSGITWLALWAKLTGP
jgi:hypothetical protein